MVRNLVKYGILLGVLSFKNVHAEIAYLDDYYKGFVANLSYYREYDVIDNTKNTYPMCIGYLNKSLAVYREYDFLKIFYMVWFKSVISEVREVYTIADFYSTQPFLFKINNNKTEKNFYSITKNYKNLTEDNYYILIDYLIDTYKMYNFSLDKETEEYVLFSGMFINSKDDGSFYPFIEIVFSKKYNLPIKIFLFDYKKKSKLEISYLDFYEIGDGYFYKKVEIIDKIQEKEYLFIVNKNILNVSMSDEKDFLIKAKEYFKIFGIKTVYE